MRVVMQRIPVSSIAPDLRFGLADIFDDPAVSARDSRYTLQVTGQLSESPSAPAYLRYSDRDAELSVLGTGKAIDVEKELARRVELLGDLGPLGDLGTAVIALDAVDWCFRESGLWSGNIYMAGAETLGMVLQAGAADPASFRRPLDVVRELAALELAYLFPIAAKFRGGRYDGEVQYRLNGWGRPLAERLAAGRAGASWSTALRAGIAEQLAAERERYEVFLGQLEVGRQDYIGDISEAALRLPIPVLV
jgi:hypothetical protein